LKNTYFRVLWNAKNVVTLKHQTTTKTQIMKNFIAIYSTATYKNIYYSFTAPSKAAAMRFRKAKFSAKRVKVVEVCQLW
jgi:hypothetical protein